MICKNKGACDACHHCSHANEEHKELAVWKEPGKVCSQTHKCEACHQLVQCIEKDGK